MFCSQSDTNLAPIPWTISLSNNLFNLQPQAYQDPDYNYSGLNSFWNFNIIFLEKNVNKTLGGGSKVNSASHPFEVD